MDTLEIDSTSTDSAKISDIVLRENSTTRLIFRGTLVNNSKDKSAPLKGDFIFQRKGKNQTWGDIDNQPLTRLKKEEGYKLSLKSGEVKFFLDSIQDVYDLYNRDGIPLGMNKYVNQYAAIPSTNRLSEYNSDDFNSFFKANEKLGSEVVTNYLEFMCSNEGTKVINLLKEMDTDLLKMINTATGIQTLKGFMEIWNDNSSNDNEEFWQNILTENSFVLEQVFSWPCTVFEDKAYVGGKTYSNKGGNIVDFLVRNSLTNNAALIEIKTPNSPLLGKKYRNVHNVSTELSGSVLQVSNYKNSLVRTYDNLTSGQGSLFHAFNPKCVVIIGKISQLGNDTAMKNSFELFRNQLTD
ncbi:MAG: DUF4263 domain-containing protein, partial [Candidatus Electrothrix sp. MAN1_4]|nr:DUF4263 domain-containing protein [Candidatus Electrothrix sp. MAN1_4]